MPRGQVSDIYHMGDDEALSTNELIEVICSALGKKAHIWNIPEHPAHAETHRELRGVKRQDQVCPGHEADASEG